MMTFSVKHSWAIISLAILAIASSTSRADSYDFGRASKKPGPIPVFSPQAGGMIGDGGGLFAGATTSLYFKTPGSTDPPFWGIGAGAYKEGDGFSVDLLAKGTFVGLIGASVGPTLHDGNPGFVYDAWVSIAWVGFRYRVTNVDDIERTTYAAFVPLGWWSWM